LIYIVNVNVVDNIVWCGTMDGIIDIIAGDTVVNLLVLIVGTNTPSSSPATSRTSTTTLTYTMISRKRMLLWLLHR